MKIKDGDIVGVSKALLVGVCDSSTLGLAPLPLCKNDLYALRDALISGLNVDSSNIILCGEHGKVTLTELKSSIEKTLSNTTDEDTFIFYFSGHGGKNILALSDETIELQELIDIIEKNNTKNKIVILDSCYSGSVSVNNIPKMDINDTVESFAGHGYAVLASCGAEQYSSFNDYRKISLYTSFVCDALTSRFLIRKGKKSLEVINEAIFHYAKLWEQKVGGNIQQPIFRSNIGGTIFFDVEEYNPYKVAKIYEETDNYIIYAIEPVHNSYTKRLSVKVVLRFQSSMEQIADIASEIQKKVLYYEVHQNEIAEAHHKGKAANIVWCYFGYDEDDMINCNFICRTTWVDDFQDKDWWYSTSSNTIFVNGVHIDVYSSYEMLKATKGDTICRDELIQLTREYSSKIITLAEQYIKVYREYLNNTITEEQLIEIVKPFNSEISLWFFKQSNLPLAPSELYDWANIHTEIACTIHDFSLFYNNEKLNKWSTENRKYLMSDAIKKYEVELEKLKDIELYSGDK